MKIQTKTEQLRGLRLPQPWRYSSSLLLGSYALAAGPVQLDIFGNVICTADGGERDAWRRPRQRHTCPTAACWLQRRATSGECA